jgi:hypothetical protein
MQIDKHRQQRKVYFITSDLVCMAAVKWVSSLHGAGDVVAAGASATARLKRGGGWASP